MNVLYGIEITETGLITHFTYVSNMLEIIKKLKFDIVLDDFGTAFSSLKYLKEFPIDQLKLDKSFADDLLENRKNSYYCEKYNKPMQGSKYKSDSRRDRNKGTIRFL